MKLHYQTVSNQLLDALNKLMRLPSLHDFVLVGGTNLALQRGHRRSIDIDLFSDKDFSTVDRNAIAEELKSTFVVCEGLDSFETREVGYHLFIGENEEDLVKLDLWSVDPFVFPILNIDGIRMADIREIAAFKFMAATQENRRQKDFWDIYELLDEFSLSEMLGFAEKRYPYNFDRKLLLQSLLTADSVDFAPEGICCLRGRYWELIVMDLQYEAKKYFIKS